MSIIPIRDEVGRGEFSLLLAKKLSQREEHLASLGAIVFTKMWNKKFCHIHWFPTIPTSLMQVVRVIDMKGGKFNVDGDVTGEYHLLVRPRGTSHGRMLHGTDLFYNGYRIKIVRNLKEDKECCNNIWFLRLLRTEKNTNEKLKKRYVWR